MAVRMKCMVLPMVALAIVAALFSAVVLEPVWWPVVAYGDEPSTEQAETAASEAAESGSVSAESKSAEVDASESAEAAGGDEDPDDVDDPSDENLVDPTQRADNSFIYDTTIDSLFEQASIYEGDTVQVVGEVIGDLIRADEGGREMYWIMLTSTETENKASISVLLTAEQAKQIDHFGRYGVTGTTLQVRGTFQQACVEHQGLPDLHATTVSALARGVEHPDSFRLRDFLPGGVAVLIGAILLGVYYFVRERSR